MQRRAFCLSALGGWTLPGQGGGGRPREHPGEPGHRAQQVPILAYHRFPATRQDSMTVRGTTLETHLRLIERLGGRVISLREVVAWHQGLRALPPRAVVLTADDGHRSQFDWLAPHLRERGWPLTLFIYPSAISNASYAMTWDQLQALAAVPADGPPLFDMQSHTLWHPNFKKERQSMTDAAFQRFAQQQLQRPRELLQQRVGQAVTLLAWPFGLYDDDLQALARACGYHAACALGNRSCSAQDSRWALPRHLMVDELGERQLAARLEAAFEGAGQP